MSDTKYAPPLDKLLTLGEFYLWTSADWVDYPALGIGPEHIPDLLRMVQDRELNDLESESSEIWAPQHALRALGQLRDESTIQPLLQILTNNEEEEDWVHEDMPRVFGLIGPVAIPALSDCLADASHDVSERSCVASALQEIALRYPEYRSSCIEDMTRTLERFEENEDELNAFIVNDLAELRAVDTLPLIEKAYKAGKVDESIIGLDFVSILMEVRKPGQELLPSFDELRASIAGAENAPVVGSLPGKPPRNYEPIKFSRSKPRPKKKKKKRR